MWIRSQNKEKLIKLINKNNDLDIVLNTGTDEFTKVNITDFYNDPNDEFIYLNLEVLCEEEEESVDKKPR